MESDKGAWSKEEQREVLLMAILPLVGAAALTLALVPARPGIWLLIFVISAVCAYASMFIAVAPLLWVFKRQNWRHWYHFAVAGFLGVFVLWLVPVLTLGKFERGIGSVASSQPGSSAPSSAIIFLLVPSVISSVAAVAFWFACVRMPRPRHGI